jgi:hypothetical protein
MEKLTTLVGRVSLGIGLLLIFSTVVLLRLGLCPGCNPVTTGLMTVGFLYAAYKTLYKKQPLSRSEWVALGILIALFVLPVVLLLMVF